LILIKHGVKPTHEQRKLIQKAGLDSHDWLVVKDQPTQMVLVHRHNKKTTKTIKKECNWEAPTFLAVILMVSFLAGVLMGDPRVVSRTKAAHQNSPEATETAIETSARETYPQTETIELLAPETAPAVVIETTAETTAETEPLPRYRSMGTFKLTAYCSCEHCCDEYALNRPKDENGNPIVYTANMSIAKQGVTVAADTNVLPFGTSLLIDGHEYIVQDRGGAIQGNRIDVYFDSHQEALQFGVQYKEVFVKGN
jgi:3D (Asp-Asp-Asp) domain-containing protein